MRPAAVVAMAALAGCATGPRVGSTSVVRAAQSAGSPDDAFGAQVRLIDQSTTRHYGEAIACDTQRVYLLLNAEGGINPYQVFEWSDVAEVRTYISDSSGLFTLWTVAGSLSTGSHGAWLVFSLPAWLIVGISSSIASGNASIETPSCAELRPYLRFPQGMPEGFREAHYPGVIPLPQAPARGRSPAPWDLP